MTDTSTAAIERLVERLRNYFSLTKSQAEAASALQALVAEREHWRGYAEETHRFLVEAEDRRDRMAAALARIAKFREHSSSLGGACDCASCYAGRIARAALVPVDPAPASPAQEAVERARHECAKSGFHDHDGCSCSDAALRPAGEGKG